MCQFRKEKKKLKSRPLSKLNFEKCTRYIIILTYVCNSTVNHYIDILSIKKEEGLNTKRERERG